MLRAGWKGIAPWLPWLGMLGLLALLLQAVHPAALLAAVCHARLWLLLPIAGCGLLGLVLRGLRWHLLLQAIAVAIIALEVRQRAASDEAALPRRLAVG